MNLTEASSRVETRGLRDRVEAIMALSMAFPTFCALCAAMKPRREGTTNEENCLDGHAVLLICLAAFEHQGGLRAVPSPAEDDEPPKAG